MRYIITMMMFVSGLAMMQIPALAADEDDAVRIAHTTAEVVDFTNKGIKFRLADKDDWLAHDTSLAAYQQMVGKTHNELIESDPKYQAMIKRSLEEREIFGGTGLAINQQREILQQGMQDRIIEFQKERADAEAVINDVRSRVQRFHDFMEDSITVDNYIRDLGFADVLTDKELCANDAKRFLAAADYLTKRFENAARRSPKGHIREKDMTYYSLSSAIAKLERWESTIPSKLRWYSRDTSEEFAFCKKLIIDKLAPRAAKLAAHFKELMKQMYGDPEDDPVIAKLLAE